MAALWLKGWSLKLRLDLISVDLLPVAVSTITCTIDRQVVLEVQLLVLGAGCKWHLLLIIFVKLTGYVLSHVNYFSRVIELICRSCERRWEWVTRSYIKVLRAKVQSLCQTSLLSDGGLLRVLTTHIFVRVRRLALVFTTEIWKANWWISDPERCWDNFLLLLGWLDTNTVKLRLNRGLEVGLRVLKSEDFSLQLWILSAYVKNLFPQAFYDKVPALEGSLNYFLNLLYFCEEAVLVALHLLLKSQQARVSGADSVVKSAMAAREQSSKSTRVYLNLIHLIY